MMRIGPAGCETVMRGLITRNMACVPVRSGADELLGCVSCCRPCLPLRFSAAWPRGLRCLSQGEEWGFPPLANTDHGSLKHSFFILRSEMGSLRLGCQESY